MTQETEVRPAFLGDFNPQRRRNRDAVLQRLGREAARRDLARRRGDRGGHRYERRRGRQEVGSQDASDELIRKLSALLTARAIKSRQPSSVAVGEYREDAGDVLEVWGREIERIYRLYRGVSVKASDYGAIEEEKRYPEA